MILAVLIARSGIIFLGLTVHQKHLLAGLCLELTSYSASSDPSSWIIREDTLDNERTVRRQRKEMQLMH